MMITMPHILYEIHTLKGGLCQRALLRLCTIARLTAVHSVGYYRSTDRGAFSSHKQNSA